MKLKSCFCRLHKVVVVVVESVKRFLHCSHPSRNHPKIFKSPEEFAKLGIQQSPEEKELKRLDTVKPSENVWSGAGYKFPAGALLLKNDVAAKYAKQIYDAFGFFRPIINRWWRWRWQLHICCVFI